MNSVPAKKPMGSVGAPKKAAPPGTAAPSGLNDKIVFCMTLAFPSFPLSVLFLVLLKLAERIGS